MSEYKPAFQRFDPHEMSHNDYLESGTEEQEHARAVSVLTGIFNPLVADFVSSIDESSVSEFSNGNTLLTRTLNYTHNSLNIHADSYNLNNHPLKSLASYVVSEYDTKSNIIPKALIGNYGETLAVSLVRSADILKWLLDQNATEKYSFIDYDYREFLCKETVNAYVLPTLHEGIQSTVAGLSLLTIDQVDGYEGNPLKLCQDIVQNNLLEEFAALIPVGYVFPMVLDGYAFRNPLENKDGKLSLSEEFRRNLKIIHVESRLAATAGSRGRGCPVAARTIPNESGNVSGVTLLGQSLLPFLYNEYEKLNKDIQ